MNTLPYTVDGIDMRIDRRYCTDEMTVAEYIEEVRDRLQQRGKGFRGATVLASLIDPVKLAKAHLRGNADSMLDALTEKAIAIEWCEWAKRNAVAIQAVVDDHNAWVESEYAKYAAEFGE